MKEHPRNLEKPIEQKGFGGFIDEPEQGR